MRTIWVAVLLVSCGLEYQAPEFTPSMIAGSWVAMQPSGVANDTREDAWRLTFTVDHNSYPTGVVATGTRAIPAGTFPILLSGTYARPDEPIDLIIASGGSWLPGHLLVYTWQGKPNIGYQRNADLDQMGGLMTFAPAP